MQFFDFDKSCFLGSVVSVDTRQVILQVENEELRNARVGRLSAIKVAGGTEEWLIAIIDKVIKTSFESNQIEESELFAMSDTEELDSEGEIAIEDNRVRVYLIGSFKAQYGDKKNYFTRSIFNIPNIEAECYCIEGGMLEKFMGVISDSTDEENSLSLGHYTLTDDAKAFLDGNKFFQRHAAILGSTGSGKSWTVASLLENAKKLSSSNLIVFDLHGEYTQLTYAKQLRIAGPDDLNSPAENILFLPYWLLNAEEMQAMFIDRSEFSAHNQVMAFQDAVTEQKKKTLHTLGKTEVLNSFTIDSPVPFSLNNVIRKIDELNKQMVPKTNGGLKQGDFHGQFSRLLVRLKSKVGDKRYGFMLHPPDAINDYDSLAENIAAKLLDFKSEGANIRVVDFSEVPADVRPVVLGLVARLIFQIQFWMENEKRHPVALVCDEAHLYLPKTGDNPVERRALENFEKIAKEGRKYGVSIVAVSQRPSDVSSTILSQCNNFISLRLTNEQDQLVVKKLLPESFRSFTDLLPILDIGEGVIVGDCVLLPSRVKITPPTEKPLSATIDFWSEWCKDSASNDIKKAVENMRKQSRK